MAIEEDEVMFSITKSFVQAVAQEKLGRELSADELETVKNGLDSGLFFDLETVLDSAFEEL
ncbi:MAG: hypothetical protein ACKVRP_15990 [Bacteroidota bacterium]